MGAIFHYLQTLDRRWIYLVLSIVLITALIVGKPVTPSVAPSVQDLYTVIDEAPAGPGEGKIILVGTTFSANTIGESGNQARAIIRHLMLRKKRFAVMAVSEPVGAELGRIIANELAKEYGYEYGKDWIAFGYQLGTLAFYKSFPLDIPGNVQKDAVHQQPLAGYEVMRGIKDINDVAVHIEISASSSVADWLMIVQPATKPRLKIGYACTGVMASEAYPYLDSGQLVGMLPGLKGAADYELLVDELDASLRSPADAERVAKAGIKRVNMFRSARQLMFTQGAAHLLIILFIILGNIGVFIAGRQAKRAPVEEQTHE